MKVASWFRMVLIGATCALGAVGCTASAEDAAAPANGDGSDGTESNADELNGSCSPSLAAGAVPPQHRALLDTIAFTEGTGGHSQDGYNITFAYHTFGSCGRHPNLRICAGKYCSTAAGRYQFLTSTWNGLGFSGFGPANQDRAGMKLVSRRGASVPTGRPLTATEFANTMNRISYEWASLPPGRYGQPSHSMSATRAQYCKHAGC